MVKKIAEKDRKISVLVGFTRGEIAFLDRKINKKHPELSSRSAIIRLLLGRAMEKPALLDVRGK